MSRQTKQAILNLGVAAMTGLALVACQSAPDLPVAGPARGSLPALATQSRPISEVIQGRGAGPLDIASSAILTRRQHLEIGYDATERVAPALIDNAQGEFMRVKYAVRDAAVDDVIRTIVGQFLERSYVLDPKLNKQQIGVTLEVDEQMTKQDVEDLLGALATLYGWSIDDRGDLMLIGVAANMPRSSTAPILEARSALGTDRTATRIYRLHNVGAKETADALKELLSEGAKSVVSGRTLVIVDRARQLNRIGKLIKALDIPAFQGSEIWTYQLGHTAAPEAAKVLTAIAMGANLNSANTGLVSFVPIERTNQLMVVSRDPMLQPLVRNWVEQVDEAPADAHRQRYLYRIQHRDPNALYQLLKATFSELLEHDDKNRDDSGMRLVLDNDEDSLIVYAQPRDYAQLLSLLTRIDVPRQQVMLQSIIAEVRLNETLQWGVDYFLQSQVNSSTLELAGSATQFGPSIPTGSVAFLASNGFAVIDALDQETDVRVLSTPVVFVRDKDEAMIQVGGSVPTISSNIDSSVQAGGTTGIRQEIQYKDTGVIMTVQPRISESGDVTLLINQEINDVVPSTSSGIDSPEFSVRKIKTTVTVPHGKTLLIGGIVSSNNTRRVGKIPLLGDIPFFGPVFQNIDNSDDRTELILAITPIIVNDPDTAPPLLNDFLAGALGVEAALREYSDVFLDDKLLQSRQDGAEQGATPRIAPATPSESALASLNELMRSMNSDADEQMRTVALFLSGLMAAAEKDGG